MDTKRLIEKAKGGNVTQVAALGPLKYYSDGSREFTVLDGIFATRMFPSGPLRRFATELDTEDDSNGNSDNSDHNSNGMSRGSNSTQSYNV